MGEILDVHKKHENILREFLQKELGNYSSVEWTIEFDPDYYGEEEGSSFFTFDYNILHEESKNSIFFRIEKDDKLETELGEDNWQETDYFTYSAIYFWMQFDWGC